MLKRIAAIAGHIGTAWGLLPSTITTYIVGTFWVIAMAIVGYLEGVPVFWIMMALPLAAAAIVTLALRASEWRSRITAAGKLSFQGVALGGDYTKNAKGKVLSIRNAQVKLVLVNTAPFPVSFVVDDLTTQFDERFPPNKPRTDIGTVIPPGDPLRVYQDHLIDMNAAPIREDEAVKGQAKFKIRYGHKGREKYPLHKNVEFSARFDSGIGAYVVNGHRDLA